MEAAPPPRDTCPFTLCLQCYTGVSQRAAARDIPDPTREKIPFLGKFSRAGEKMVWRKGEGRQGGGRGGRAAGTHFFSSSLGAIFRVCPYFCGDEEAPSAPKASH